MKNAINELLPFSTFNWCHRYSVKMTSFLTQIFAVLLSLFFQVMLEFD